MVLSNIDSESYEEYIKREDNYHNLATDIKEKYAHNFADQFKNEMTKIEVIPFAQINDKKGTKNNKGQ